MTQSNKSASKAGGASRARKSKSATQPTSPDKTLKQNQLDDISAGKLPAERDPQKPRPPGETDA